MKRIILLLVLGLLVITTSAVSANGVAGSDGTSNLDGTSGSNDEVVDPNLDDGASGPNDVDPNSDDGASASNGSNGGTTNFDFTDAYNPASMYCVEQGHRLIIREDAAGNQYGVCKSGNMECDEWDFYNGLCFLEPKCPEAVR